MANDIPALSIHITEHSDQILRAPIARIGVLNYKHVGHLSGVKQETKLPKLGVALVGQAGGCSLSPSGSTSITQYSINTSKIAFRDNMCQDDWESTFAARELEKGQFQDKGILFETVWVEEMQEQIELVVEELIWRGNTTGATGNLALTDGFITRLNNDSLCPKITFTGATTESNVIERVNTLVRSRTSAMKSAKDGKLFMSIDTFEIYVEALNVANRYHEDARINEYTYKHHTSGLQIVATAGLDEATVSGQEMIFGSPRILFTASDLTAEETDRSFRLMYDDMEDVWKYLIKFRLGTAVAYGEHAILASVV